LDTKVGIKTNKFLSKGQLQFDIKKLLFFLVGGKGFRQDQSPGVLFAIFHHQKVDEIILLSKPTNTQHYYILITNLMH